MSQHFPQKAINLAYFTENNGKFESKFNLQLCHKKFKNRCIYHWPLYLWKYPNIFCHHVSFFVEKFEPKATTIASDL